MKDELNELGRFVRQARVALGLTQRDLAERLGVSAGHYAKIEAGYDEALPSPRMTLRLSRVLGVDYEELYAFRPEPTEELPELPVYLRSRYGLTGEAASEVETYVRELQARSTSKKGGDDGSRHSRST